MNLPFSNGPEIAPGAARCPGARRTLFVFIPLTLFFLGDAAAVPITDAPETQRLLVIYAGNRLLPSNLLFDECLREAMAARSDSAIEVVGEFLDEIRFPRRYQERMRDLLAQKYGDRRVDAVLAFTSPSLAFCIQNRDALFRDVPIVFAGIGFDTLLVGPVPPALTGVRSRFDAAATLRLALKLHPRTRQVFVLPADGSSKDRSAGMDPAHLRDSEFPIPIHRLEREPLTPRLQDVAAIPENSVVLDLSGIGERSEALAAAREAMRRIAETALAPIYGNFDPLVGQGLVGAVTTPIDASARAAAEVVVALLARAPGEPPPPIRELAATTILDHRELRRWGLRKNQLPAGSIVRFESRSFWRQHLLLVVTTGVLFLLQSALILSLVLQSRRRRRAEMEVRRRREELAHMTRVATMGELTASLAHEINQPLAAILSNAQAAQRLLSAGGEHGEEIQEILADIAADDLRAGEVIRRMRDLLRKGESHPSEIDLSELVDEVVGIVHGEMILQNVSLELQLSPMPLRVQGDRVQLQQVLLNLIVNALDAMKESTGGNRRVVVRTQANESGRAAEVAVQDSGLGLPVDKIDQIFEPFYTTKAHGLGLGLAICRSIIQSHGGRIGSRNNADRGATFWFTLPVTEERKA